MSGPVITLTTDFGQMDGYVGAMKGVMLSICPDAALVDISHEIRPQAVEQATITATTTIARITLRIIHIPFTSGNRPPSSLHPYKTRPFCFYFYCKLWEGRRQPPPC